MSGNTSSHASSPAKKGGRPICWDQLTVRTETSFRHRGHFVSVKLTIAVTKFSLTIVTIQL